MKPPTRQLNKQDILEISESYPNMSELGSRDYGQTTPKEIRNWVYALDLCTQL